MLEGASLLFPYLSHAAGTPRNYRFIVTDPPPDPSSLNAIFKKCRLAKSGRFFPESEVCRVLSNTHPSLGPCKWYISYPSHNHFKSVVTPYWQGREEPGIRGEALGRVSGGAAISNPTCCSAFSQQPFNATGLLVLI